MDHDLSGDAQTDRVRALKVQWGSALRQRRKELGWSCERVARMTSFTTSTLSNVERGLNAPSEELRMQLSEIFLVPVEQLFPYPAPDSERIAS